MDFVEKLVESFSERLFSEFESTPSVNGKGKNLPSNVAGRVVLIQLIDLASRLPVDFYLSLLDSDVSKPKHIYNSVTGRETFSLNVVSEKLELPLLSISFLNKNETIARRNSEIIEQERASRQIYIVDLLNLRQKNARKKLIRLDRFSGYFSNPRVLDAFNDHLASVSDVPREKHVYRDFITRGNDTSGIITRVTDGTREITFENHINRIHQDLVLKNPNQDAILGRITTIMDKERIPPKSRFF